MRLIPGGPYRMEAWREKSEKNDRQENEQTTKNKAAKTSVEQEQKHDH